MYQQLPDFNGQPAQAIKRIADGAMIPFDPANTDYQAYLEWVAEGNTPEPTSMSITAADVIAEEQRRLVAERGYAIPGGPTIQMTLTPTVQQEMQAQVSAAGIASSQGVTDPIFKVWGSNGTEHDLTPQQMMALFMTGVQYGQALRAKRKALEAMDPIPADYADDKWWL